MNTGHPNVLPMPAMRFAQAAAVLAERVKRDAKLAYIALRCSAFGGDAVTIGYAFDGDDTEIVQIWLHGIELYDHLSQSMIEALYGPLMRALADVDTDARIDNAIASRSEAA